MSSTLANNSITPEKNSISDKDIPANERLIFALDVSTVEEAKRLVVELGDSVHFYKLGLEIFMAGGYYELIDWLRKGDEKFNGGKKVFVDLKFFDVPETVRSAVSQLKNRGVEFATVHGNDNILKAAVKNKYGIKILAVTVLTSLDHKDMEDLGFECNIEDLVYSRARRALEIGCSGVISSGLEVKKLRKDLGDNFVIVAPGIRPVFNDIVGDDQKRIVTVEEAFLNGADYIVVGRPIKNAASPKKAAEEIQSKIKTIFK